MSSTGLAVLERLLVEERVVVHLSLEALDLQAALAARFAGVRKQLHKTKGVSKLRVVCTLGQPSSPILRVISAMYATNF
jgi:hypothetical protein